MEFIKPDTHVNFLGKRKYAFSASLFMILLTIVMLLWRGGPNYGVDFSGGILIQVKLPEKHSPGEIRDALRKIQLQDSSIQVVAAAAAEVLVVTKAFAATPLAASADPALKPNHPNHRRAAPITVVGML